MNKFILKSKTIWGLILVSLPTFVQVAKGFGLDIPTEIVDDADAAAKSLFSAAEAVSAAVGVILGVWGRYTATSSISINPKAK